jgi:ABC-type Fe3+-siderophore transport system permease subunit
MALTCLGPMYANIHINGVNPNAYKDFVDYTQQRSQPISNEISSIYISTMTNIFTTIALLAFIILLITFIVIIMALEKGKSISRDTAIIAGIVISTIISIYFACVFTYIKKIGSLYSNIVQKQSVDSIVYTINSILRDLIYIELQK